MIVRWGALKRAEGLNDDEFQREWLEHHVPLVQGVSGLRSYHQNVVIDAEQRSPFPRGGEEFDGFAQLEFDSLHSMRSAMALVQADPQVDIAHFAREVSTLACVRKFDMVPPSGRNLVKRISLLTRSQEVSAAEFQQEWWAEHSRLVAAMPGYVGYAQNLVVEVIGETGPGTAADAGIDGIVEFWFEDVDSMQACYASQEFAEVAQHGEQFIGEITTYLVAEYRAETGGHS